MTANLEKSVRSAEHLDADVRQPRLKSPEMADFAAGSSGMHESPCTFALKKRKSDFQCRISCTENLCRLGGLGSHDGLGGGHDGPPAIVPSIIACITAVKGLKYYVARVTTAR